MIVACTECDFSDVFRTTREATRAGWAGVTKDDAPDVPKLLWTHLGKCPECIAEDQEALF